MEWIKTLDVGFKVAFIIAAGLIWAIVAAADNLARGLATAAKTPVQLPSGLSASRIVHVNGGPNLTDPGWSVVAVLAPTTATGTADFLIVKNGTTAWVAANKLTFP